MMHQFDLHMLICSKRTKVHYEYISVQLSSKIRIIKNENMVGRPYNQPEVGRNISLLIRRLNFVIHYSKNLLALRSSVIQCPASRFDGITFLWFNMLKTDESLI